MNRACKVCTSPDRDQINRFLANRESVRAVAEWTESVKRPISRPTISKHLAHALDLETQFVENAPPTTISRVSSTEFLQKVVDTGAKRVVTNPEEVTVAHALKAAATLEQKRDRGRDGLRVLILALTGRPEPSTIEGQFTELT